MYPALEPELYQGGSYLVVGRIFFSDQNQVHIHSVFFSQEVICLQESWYVFVFPKLSHGEDVFFVDTFFREKLFRFIFLGGSCLQMHGRNDPYVFLWGIEYFDDITFEDFAECDDGTGFPYAIAEDGIIPMTHEGSFQMFVRIEIRHEVREDDDALSKIKKGDVRSGEKHDIQFFPMEFIRKRYLFAPASCCRRGFYGMESGGFLGEIPEFPVVEKKYVLVRILVFYEIGYESLHISSHISMGRTIGAAVYSDSHHDGIEVLYGSEYRDFPEYCNGIIWVCIWIPETKTRISPVFPYTS